MLEFDSLGEYTIRESLAFRHLFSEEDRKSLPDILNNVRLSQERFRRQDLSELDAASLHRAAAVASVSLELMRRNKGCGREYLDSMMPNMTSALSQVITENVDRTQEIIDYIRLYGFTAEQIDAGHLLEYLENPTRSLSEGVL
jgi:hypothetical protein